ncbi:auxin-responsive protein SAUR64-like [Aristolochia californica]|uniref:auxin-responsive protein SAUR64-like n=1 Tax=Aristolochia californica TaxID=171875 RepID=UPI0035E2A3F9
MAKKWQRIAAIRRKRISHRKGGVAGYSVRQDKMVAGRGHFVFYTTDQKRFEVPLNYLSTPIFEELFKISEEEYGLTSNSPLRLPCNSVLMEAILRLLTQRVSKETEKAVILSISSCRHSSALHFEGFSDHQRLVHGF